LAVSHIYLYFHTLRLIGDTITPLSIASLKRWKNSGTPR